MTENEAKKHLELCKTSRLFIPNNDVLEVAIQALEEIQQYRAIGTVEEIENSFKKTINAFEKANPLIKSALDILQEYQSIGTIDEFKDLKEKNNKDFELLLKAVKESYPMFKGAYVELDVFMGDVMRRFTRGRKQY